MGSNHRPLACKASALPLSYAPIPLPDARLDASAVTRLAYLLSCGETARHVTIAGQRTA